MVVSVGEVTVIITDYKLKSDSSFLEDSIAEDMAIYSTDTESE